MQTHQPGLGGQFVRRLGRLAVRFYYPRIEFTGRDHIPDKGSVLVCANHANSLLDPVLVGMTARRPVRFFAKAPLFKTPVLGPLMEALGMIPAFRGQDDRRQVKNNQQSLDKGVNALVQGDAVGIFPEGKSHDYLRVEMVRGGAARMALAAVRQGAEQLQLLPLGLNYRWKERFRSSVWIQVGTPLSVASWLAERQAAGEEDPRRLARQLTEELQTRMQQVTIHLAEPEWSDWLEDLEALAPPVRIDPASKVPFLYRRKRIAEAINYFAAADRSLVEQLSARIKNFRERAAGLGLRMATIAPQGHSVTAALVTFLLALAGVVALVPVLAVTLFHLLPFFLVRWIAARFTRIGKTTVSMYRLLVGIPGYLGWYLLGFSGLRSLWPAGALPLTVAMPVLGIASLHYWRAWPYWTGNTISLLRWFSKRAAVRELLVERQELDAQLAQLAEKFRATQPADQ